MWPGEQFERAADAIETLQAENARLRAALAEAVDRYGQPGGRFLCGLMVAPSAFIFELHDKSFGDEILSKMFREMIGSGMGCDSDVGLLP